MTVAAGQIHDMQCASGCGVCVHGAWLFGSATLHCRSPWRACKCSAKSRHKRILLVWFTACEFIVSSAAASAHCLNVWRERGEKHLLLIKNSDWLWEKPFLTQLLFCQKNKLFALRDFKSDKSKGKEVNLTQSLQYSLNPDNLLGTNVKICWQVD